MPDLTFLITHSGSLIFPTSLIGWLGWFAFLAIIILLNLNWRTLNQQLDGWHTRVLILILISVPVSTLFLPSLNFTPEGFDYSLPIFGAISWFLAAGLFGPGAASGIAFLSGLIISVWGGNNIFLPLEMAFIATWLGWMFFQEYRTPFFHALRHPILASIPIVLVYPLIYMIGTLFLSQGSIGMRLAFGLRQILAISLTFAFMILVAGMISEIFVYSLKSKWGAQQNKKPSPAESKLSNRFLISVVPLSIVLLGVLIISAWFIAGRAARQMLEGRMSTAAEMTAQSIPFYLETGQNLLLRLANEPFYERSTDDIHTQLVTQRREIPYFSQLIYLNPDGELIASDPDDAITSPALSQEEIDRIGAASIVPIDIISVNPEEGSAAALLSFIAGVNDQNGDLRGILIGRSDLAVNPFAKSLITSIGSLSVLDGEGMLVDENGFILYHADPDQVMGQYTGSRSTTPQFFEEFSPDGESDLYYFHPVKGKPWSVIVSVPSRFIQQQAINIALPLLVIITILVIIAVFIFRYGLRSVTSSLEDLALQANRMSRGELDQPLETGGVDEVGQLRLAFEKMRSSLKSRLDELNRLLFVSQGIASTFDLEESLKRVLESSLGGGASSARVYLLPSIIPNSTGEPSSSFQMGSGSASEEYAFLDEQVSRLTERQEILKLNNLTRPKIFSYPNDEAPPQAILAIALRRENQYYGTLWIAFEDPHQFNDEEVRYISTLAGQAALAAANARLFLTTEIGRKRLESVLNSTPDPVFVTDQEDNLLLANSAAQETFNLYDEAEIGKPISDAISHEDVLALLHSDPNQYQSKEIIFNNGKTYLATVSTVEVEGIGAGRVCVLRDVTSIKQLNSSKSDFVSTVSHDLRSPLALIQGYTSMLQMVGDLNEQQTSYLKKISNETEKISHLVTNLLDLGRIEAGVGLHLEKKAVDDVVERVIAAAQVQADQKRINLVSKIEAAYLPSIEADQALLQQALFNLVDNAIKYTNPGGDVFIRLQTSEDQVVYIVEDNGIGISPADQQNLFEKFFQISNKQGLEAGGSGLGLAIVNSIAEKHSGKVRVESQLGIGSTFYLELPLHQEKS
ncbi:MAG: ATP-binding protein [Anaerolineales bacterium]|nr:ATP-binding protein [Anaerolineales bacterium]